MAALAFKSVSNGNDIHVIDLPSLIFSPQQHHEVTLQKLLRCCPPTGKKVERERKERESFVVVEVPTYIDTVVKATTRKGSSLKNKTHSVSVSAVGTKF